MLLEIIEDLEYVAEYEGPDGIALRVRGNVDGREFDGVQLFRFNAEGLIDECRDLIRPHSAGTALMETSAEYIAHRAEFRGLEHAALPKCVRSRNIGRRHDAGPSPHRVKLLLGAA